MIWDLSAKNPPVTLAESAATHSIAVARDGSLVASIRDADGAVLLWRDRGGKPTLLAPRLRASDVVISPDSARIATGETGAVSLWNAVTGQRLARHAYSPPIPKAEESKAPRGPSTTALAFSEDGRWLAAGGTDARLRLWDAATLAPIRTFPGALQSTVTCVAFSPDGSLLASASEDGTARIWRVSDGAEIRTLAHAGSWSDSLSPNVVWGVAFHPAGTLLATSCADRKVRIWGVRPASEE